jgi:hypothetical protein
VTLQVLLPKGPMSAVDDSYVGLLNRDFRPKAPRRTILNDQRWGLGIGVHVGLVHTKCVSCMLISPDKYSGACQQGLSSHKD